MADDNKPAAAAAAAPTTDAADKAPEKAEEKQQEQKQQQQQQQQPKQPKQKQQQQQKKGGGGGGSGGGGGGGGGKKKEAAKSKFDVSSLKDPAYFAERIAVFDKLKEAYDAEVAAKERVPIKLTLPDGSTRDAVAWQSTPLDVAKSISTSLAKAVVVAKVDGKVWDLHRPLEASAAFELCKFDSPEGKHTFWHSSAHILGEALELFYGESAKLCIGPPIDDGFYYDVALGERKVLEDDYAALQAVVDHVVKQRQRFERVVVPKELALKMFAYNKYKVEIISNKVPDGETITVYRCGPLIDLCRGPHVPDTGVIKAFKVTKNSAAYWLGKAENDSLQRVYGVAFPDNKGLKDWEEFQRQAALRNHRTIGAAQELFFFHPMSPGSAFFLPHGARIYNKLVDTLKREYYTRGFEEVVSPNVYNSDLWRTSGHWDHYQDNMFTFDVEKHPYGLKPMNCPGHCLIFAHKFRNYKDLPMRLADFGVLHRNELSGALSGLTRVRRFQQDDAHIFCMPSQMREELNNCLAFMEFIYTKLKFDFSMELSTRPEKFLGDIKVWNDAEAALEDALKQYAPGRWKLNPGDGAFYGPKIDVHIKDAIGRSFQCATIQLDFQLPERFKLEYQDDKGAAQRPLIIHRAIYGSVERFMAILMEHTAGKWPFWISPRQVAIVPVSAKFYEYAQHVSKELRGERFHVDVDETNETLQKKIRNNQLAQYNYILVVGEKEQEEKTVNIRTRDNVVHGTASIEEFKQRLKKDVDEWN